MKKIATGLMAAVLCVGMHPVGQALEYGTDIAPSGSYVQQFSDVPTNHWAFSYIAELSNRGAINGFVDGKYYPNNTVTRAQFAKIMTVAAGLTPKAGSSTAFADVPASHWSAPYVAIAQSYMTYYQQNGQYVFQPNAAALREDIAFAVVRMKGYDISMADEGALEVMFSDYASISEALRPYVAVAVEKGVISGYPDGTFRAQNTVTRAEAATILWRAFQLGSDNKVVNGNDTNTQQPTEQKPQQPTATQPTTQKPTVTQPTQQEQKPQQPTEQKPQRPTTTEPAEQKPQQSTEQQPEPTQPTPQYKYRTEKVNSLSTSANEYVMTKNGDVYYIKDNQLFLSSNGSTQKLFDGNADYYQEMTLGEMAARLKEAPSWNVWGASYIEEYEQYYSEDILYFDKLLLKSVGYDAKNDAVYVFGDTYAKGRGADTPHFVGTHFIYNAADMTAPVYQSDYQDIEYNGKPFNYPFLICADDFLLYDSGSQEGHQLKVDPISGQTIDYGDKFRSDEKYLQVGGEIVCISSYSLSKMNLSSGSWDSINLADNGIKQSDAVCAYQDEIYFATWEGIYRLEPAGTNRMKSVAVLTWDEVEVTDGAPIGSISKMLFDQDGNILFFDSTQNWVRKIVLG